MNMGRYDCEVHVRSLVLYLHDGWPMYCQYCPRTGRDYISWLGGACRCGCTGGDG